MISIVDDFIENFIDILLALLFIQIMKNADYGNAIKILSKLIIPVRVDAVQYHFHLVWTQRDHPYYCHIVSWHNFLIRDEHTKNLFQLHCHKLTSHALKV